MSAAAAVVKTSPLAVIMTCFAAFGGFLYGYDTGYISGVKEMRGWLELFGQPRLDAGGQPVINAATGLQEYFLPSGDDSLVTSILSAGTFVGALLAFPVGDFLGRRYGIVVYLIVFCAGVAMQTAATEIPLFAVGRVFAGLGVGGTSCLVPMYQSECAPKHIRGAIVAAYQWMITIGLLIAAIVANGTKDIDGAACYRIPIGLQFIWAFILGVGLMLLPESPRYLLMKGREEKAQRAIARILGRDRDSADVHEEYAEIAANLHHERAVGAPSYLACFKNGPGKNRLRVCTGIALQALQQLTGINFIFYYGTQFFANSGIDNPFIITIATNVVNVGMTVPGMWAVDKLGRRTLLLYGAAVMCISQLIVAIVGTVIDESNQAGNKVLIAFVCVFIGHFAATWGPLAWVVTGEIYSTSIRGRAMSMSTASNWLFNFAIGYATPYLVNTGPGNAGLQAKVFFIWSGCCALAFVFTFFFIPETKGLSLEQVDILYRNSSILKSNQFRKEILANNIHDDDKEAYQNSKAAGRSEHVEKRELGGENGHGPTGRFDDEQRTAV